MNYFLIDNMYCNGACSKGMEHLYACFGWLRQGHFLRSVNFGKRDDLSQAVPPTKVFNCNSVVSGLNGRFHLASMKEQLYWYMYLKYVSHECVLHLSMKAGVL